MLSVTLVPVLMLLFVRGTDRPGREEPGEPRADARLRPIIRQVMRHPKMVIAVAVLALVATAWPARQLGSEFMPTLNEGTLFYMPASLPGMSVTKASELLQLQNRLIKQVPEVESVFGKAGSCQHRHRPGAAGNVRDGHQPQAASSSGARA